MLKSIKLFNEFYCLFYEFTKITIIQYFALKNMVFKWLPSLYCLTEAKWSFSTCSTECKYLVLKSGEIISSYLAYWSTTFTRCLNLWMQAQTKYKQEYLHFHTSPAKFIMFNFKFKILNMQALLQVLHKHIIIKGSIIMRPRSNKSCQTDKFTLQLFLTSVCKLSRR